MSHPELTLEQDEAEVVNHLLFHKSLLSEGDEAQRITQYIEMVKASREGAHLVMVNPFDRAIAIAFQLVMEKHLDPWRIDLVQFTDLYLEHVRKGGEVDLITAGRLIFMAWAVLKLQSDEALVHAEASRWQPAPQEPEVSWDDIQVDPHLLDEGDFAFTTAVLQNRQAPIDEKVRHRGDRKVTLFELVEAFEEARSEAESRLILDAKRREARQAWAVQRKSNVEGAAHKEDLEAEIREVWGRIAGLNGHPIPLRDLHGRDREDLVKALVSVLFLAREQHVRLWQENFPYGPIFIQNEHPGETPPELGPRPPPAPPKPPKAKRAKKAKQVVPQLPILAQLQVAAGVANALAKLLPPEVSRDG